MKRSYLIGGAVILIVVGTFWLRGRNSQTSAAGGKSQVTTIKVAHTQSYVPYDFINEAGESDGYEVQVLKAVDKKLPQYQLEFTGTSDEDLLIGLESGKYDLGIKGAWYTEERAEKFLIPKEAVGASVIGFTIRNQDAQKFTSIDDLAKNAGKLVPISPQNAQYNVITEYNEKHPDQPLELKAAESFNVADAYAWVLEGRYDAFFDIKLSFETAVTKKDGSYHQYADDLSWFPYKGIPTYPLLYKNQQNKDFATAYDQAVKELAADGTLAQLSEEYFGENVFDFVTE